MPNHFTLTFFLLRRRDVSCSHSNRDLFTCEDNMLFSHVKISCFRAKAHLVFHWYLYNKLCLLRSSLGNTVLLHMLFLEYETQIGKKNLDNVFQSNCSSHAKLLTNLRKIEKRPKMRHKVVMHPALQLYPHYHYFLFGKLSPSFPINK